jgi:Mrp family chromosome partitioning ATPase
VLLRAPQSAAANAYRLALHGIQTVAREQQRCCYLIVAVDGSADGAMVTANLGVAAALSGLRTILVDANLGQPRLHALFNLGNESGVTTLHDQAGAQPCLQSAGVGELLLLPTGPRLEGSPDLVSPTLAEGLRQVTAGADLVLVSSAPLLTAPDAALLASWVTGIVLVLRPNRTRQEALRRARHQLERLGSRLVGVILDGGTR